MTPFLDAAPIQPLSAEYHNSVHPADTKISPTQSVSKLFVSAKGMTRVDFGDTSVISDAVAKQSVFLDHLKKEAHVVPFGPPDLPKLEMPPLDMPKGPPPLPSGPEPIDVKDLGKRYLDGHEVVGKQFVFPPPVIPEPPKLPELPKAPDLPKLPEPPKLPDLAKVADVKAKVPGGAKLPDLPKLPAGAKLPDAAKLAGEAKLPDVPKLPDAPKAPDAPKLPEAEAPEPPPLPELPPMPPLKETISEVWSSTSLFIPMLSRTLSSWGKQISHCKVAIPGEPDPTLFEIPADYKQIEGFQNEPAQADIPATS